MKNETDETVQRILGAIFLGICAVAAMLAFLGGIMP